MAKVEAEASDLARGMGVAELHWLGVPARTILSQNENLEGPNPDYDFRLVDNPTVGL
jgi:hypothetical protein